MTWVKIDDGFHEHPKISALTNAAYRLYMGGLCYAGRRATDGFVPTSALKPLGGVERAADELVAAGLWHISGKVAGGAIDCQPCDDGAADARWRGYGGWVIHDFLHYNPSAREQGRRRNDARDRMADLRQAKGGRMAAPAAPVELDRSQDVRANISEVPGNISNVR